MQLSQEWRVFFLMMKWEKEFSHIYPWACKFIFSRTFSACCLHFLCWKGQKGIRIPCAIGVIPSCYWDARFFQYLMGWGPLQMTVAGSGHWETLKGCLCTAYCARLLLIVSSVVFMLLNTPLSFSAWQICFLAPGQSQSVRQLLGAVWMAGEFSLACWLEP